MSEKTFPTLHVEETASHIALQDFGAVGDGVADDSQAFLDAVEAIGREGTIFIPEGRYIITKQINIPRRIVLRGVAPIVDLGGGGCK